MRTLLTFLAILLVFSSCENQENVLHKTETNKITRKKISLTELKNHESIFNKFDEVSKKN